MAAASFFVAAVQRVMVKIGEYGFNFSLSARVHTLVARRSTPS